MFFTGVFSFCDGAIQTVNKAHSEDKPYNDDLSWYDGISRDFFESANGSADGSVTNIGSKATIRIKHEFNSESNIEYIKEVFGLKEKYGVNDVTVEEL